MRNRGEHLIVSSDSLGPRQVEGSGVLGVGHRTCLSTPHSLDPRGMQVKFGFPTPSACRRSVTTGHN
jgi:hypothetical protein